MRLSPHTAFHHVMLLSVYNFYHLFRCSRAVRLIWRKFFFSYPNLLIKDLYDFDSSFTLHDLWPFLRFHYRNFTGSTTAFWHRFGCLLFFVSLFPFGNPIPFLVPMILSVHIPLGFCYEPVDLILPRYPFRFRQQWFFIYTILTQPYQLSFEIKTHFYASCF